MIEILLKIGLSKKEAAVYLAALEQAEDTAQSIARKAGVNRATTYVILEKLMKLGLMTTVQKGKKTYFMAESPTELVNTLEEQKRGIEKNERLIRNNLDQFMAIFNAKKGKPTVRYFEGADGLVTLDKYGHDQIKPETEFVAVMPIDLIEAQFPTRRRETLQDRIKQGIKSSIFYTRERPFTAQEDRNELKK